MHCKTGEEHLKSLQDGRTVYIDGEVVDDVTTHPAYRNAVASSAGLYDYQARPENIELMTFLPEGGTRRVSRCWQMPRNYDELVQRRKALQAWAQVSYGFMGRSPDHVASTLIGQRMGLEVFQKHGPARAKALADYVDYATKSDLFLTYVIVNPQADRSKDWGEQAEELVAQIVDEDNLVLLNAGAIDTTTPAEMKHCISTLRTFLARTRPP
jgi:4-hydroxyphenylacetate 3-monooxygenase